MPLVPENINSERPDGRQDVHNSGIDTQLAGAHLCGQTDLRLPGGCGQVGRVTTERASSFREDARTSCRVRHPSHSRLASKCGLKTC